MSIQSMRELWDWWASLPREMLFLFSLPFIVAAAGLLADGYRRRRAHNRMHTGECSNNAR